MSETLKSIMDSYRSGLLSTPNIQVLEKRLSNETIKFPEKLMANTTFYFSTFKNSSLVKMQFINVHLESSYFENCIFENCIFEKTHFRNAEFDNCMFKNCWFIRCTLHEVEITKTIFNDCKFFKSGFDNAVFELCHFLKPIFEGVKGVHLGSAVIIDSKFSNSKKSIEFKEEFYFNDIFDQIDKFYIDEE